MRKLLYCIAAASAASAATRPRPLRLHRGGSAAAALTNASALNATGEALDLNDAHDNATISNATATNKTDEGLRASIKAYFRGAKELWGDVKTWRRLRREAKNGTNMILSWHERRGKSKTIPHSLRMLPILANPLPPPFGLVLVGIASLVPRTLLTPEFWTDNQALTFATEDGADVKRRHAKLLDALAAAAGGDGKTGSDGGLDALGDVGGAFGAGASLELSRLRRKHLIRLARCIRPHPPSRWSLHFLRTASIRERLADAARAMSEEDEALARDVSLFQNASAPLSPREVLEVCAERGLAVGGDHARRLARLERWCEARATLLSALGAGPDDDSASLVLHMPALLSALLEKAEEAVDDDELVVA